MMATVCLLDHDLLVAKGLNLCGPYVPPLLLDLSYPLRNPPLALLPNPANGSPGPPLPPFHHLCYV